jgi:hypothetical protein
MKREQQEGKASESEHICMKGKELTRGKRWHVSQLANRKDQLQITSVTSDGEEEDRKRARKSMTKCRHKENRRISR